MLSTVVIVPPTEITRVGATAALVAYMTLATAMLTPEKPHQKALPGTDRGHRFVTLPVHGITPGHSLILFVGGPVNITHVVIADKEPAIFGSTCCTLTLLQPALNQRSRKRSAAPNISAAIEGVAENVVDQALGRDLPHQPRPLDRVDW